MTKTPFGRLVLLIILVWPIFSDGYVFTSPVAKNDRPARGSGIFSRWHPGAPAFADDSDLLKMAREGRITFDFVKGLEKKDLELIKGFGGWDTTETKYFRILHGTSEIDAGVSSDVAKRIDMVYCMFQRNFGFVSEAPVKCYIYPYENELMNAKCSANSQSFIDDNSMALNIRNRRKPLDTDEIMSTIAHEYAHLSTLRLAGRKKYEPVMSEGIAAFVECSLSGYSWENYDRKKIAARLKKIGKVKWDHYDDWAKFYACADFYTLPLSVYSFLDEKYGREKLVKFAAMYFGGGDPPYAECFLKVYGKPVNALNDEWSEYYGLDL